MVEVIVNEILGGLSESALQPRATGLQNYKDIETQVFKGNEDLSLKKAVAPQIFCFASTYHPRSVSYAVRLGKVNPKKNGEIGTMPATILENLRKESWFSDHLTIFVFGASGDLSKKKTFPALFDLFIKNILPKQTLIIGYARSTKTQDEFKGFLRPFLEKKVKPEMKEKVDEFFEMCLYRHGDYADCATLTNVSKEATRIHMKFNQDEGGEGKGEHTKQTEQTERTEKNKLSFKENRVFYFALPPQVFLVTSQCVTSSMRLTDVQRGEGDQQVEPGFTRVVVEKPFGHDLSSAKELATDLSKCFQEEELFRIDHYLGKELVQNTLILRFGNTFTEPMWNRNHIKSVMFTFKENFGTQGRGGYFEESGIIRDIMQNHLMQVLSLIAMEPPVKLRSKNPAAAAEFIRDEKVKVLKCIEPWRVENCVLGQYVSDKEGKNPGYKDDDTVAKDSTRETYCCVVMYINNKRWAKVPFIMKAGKALDERKAEVRIQLRNPPACFEMFDGEADIKNQELVIRLQPNEAIYMKTNVKQPGLEMNLIQSELNLSYHDRYSQMDNPDAYTRLILDVLRGKQSTFVRTDELMAAWEIVTPLLNIVEGKDTSVAKPKVLDYEYGSRGPKEADELIKSVGYQYDPEYAKNWRNRKQPF